MNPPFLSPEKNNNDDDDNNNNNSIFTTHLIIALSAALFLLLLLLITWVVCTLLRRRHPSPSRSNQETAHTLRDLLFGDRSPSLGWPARMGIIKQVAYALLRIHERASGSHGAISLDNVAVEDGMRVRLGPRGTVGSTVADDVYAFGVLALEVVCGRQGEDVVDLVWGARGDLAGAVDGRVVGEGFRMEEAGMVLQLGKWCTLREVAVRPNMGIVVRVLEGKRVPEVRGLWDCESGSILTESVRLTGRS